jgi:phage shock protein A
MLDEANAMAELNSKPSDGIEDLMSKYDSKTSSVEDELAALKSGNNIIDDELARLKADK